jgi:hypothetical protein
MRHEETPSKISDISEARKRSLMRISDMPQTDCSACWTRYKKLRANVQKLHVELSESEIDPMQLHGGDLPKLLVDIDPLLMEVVNDYDMLIHEFYDDKENDPEQ